MTRSQPHPIRNALLLGVAVYLVLSLWHWFCGVAHAGVDPTPVLTGAVDSSWDTWTKDGPLWLAVAVLHVALRAFLDRQHWLQQGRLLTALTAAAGVLTAVAAWHFQGAPSAGILTAVVVGGGLLLHPVAQPATGRNPQAGFARFSVMGILAAIAIPPLVFALVACTAAQRANAKTAIVNCTGQVVGTQPALDLSTLVAAVNLAATERAKCTTTAGLDWQCVKRDLISQGVVLGGCTLATMVADAAKAFTSGGDKLSMTTPVLPGRAELAEFHAEVAQGVTYHTGAGDL